MPAQSSDDVHAAINKSIQGISALAFKKSRSTNRSNNVMSADEAGVCSRVFIELDHMIH